MENEKPTVSETPSNSDHAEVSQGTKSRVSEILERAAGSSAAAKLSGAFHETAGKIKQKVGELSERPELQAAGRKEELLGKVHAVVGEIREIREMIAGSAEKYSSQFKGEYKDLMKSQASRLLDSASAFLEDLKKKLD
jgi:uncharacterized protein YjbJ (UPF0337 family)